MLLFLSVLINTGCATIGADGDEQVVLVNSEPQGARVFYRGQDVGSTPMFLQMEAEAKPSFDIQGLGLSEKKTVNLETKYRWKRSFLYNFVWAISYAPIGWLVDYFTGGAWEIQSPDVIQLPGAKPATVPKSQQTLAISPPRIRSFEISSQLGRALEEDLRRNTPYQVYDYRYSEPRFYSYERMQGLPKDPQTQELLFSELENDLVVVSKVKAVSDKTIQVSGSIKDVYTGKVISKFKRNYATDNLAVNSHIYLAKNLGDYFYFLPNTFFVNLGRPTQSITIDDQEYNGSLTRSDSAFDQVGQVIERISLSRVIPIQNTRISHWDFSFIPDFNVSRDTIQYEGFTPIEDQSFKRLVVSVGYGGRVAYVANWGMPYLDLVPHLGWTQISSSGGDFDVNVTDDFIAMSIELGYIYHLNRHWIVKAFSRSTGENPEIWQKVINETNDSEFLIDSNNKLFAGISFGYRFDFGDWQETFRPIR